MYKPVFAVIIATLTVFSGQSNLQAQESSDGTRRTTEPVFRVPKRSKEVVAPPVEKVASKPTELTPAKGAEAKPVAKTTANKPHPLDRALETAENGLQNIRENITDYSAILVKRERVNNKLREREYMKIKVRNAREVNGQKVPFSVYMKFLKPRNTAGREVIWVEGSNDGKMLVHESGILGLKTFHLDPTGVLAMKDNKYPIYDAGIENLVVKLIEKASRDRDAGDCVVNYREGAKINKRSCSMIEVIHEQRRTPYDFHKAQVFIDDEMNIPVRYAAYDWPATAGGKPELMEEYTYVQVKLNVGLKDIDFDHTNPAYDYPKR